MQGTRTTICRAVLCCHKRKEANGKSRVRAQVYISMGPRIYGLLLTSVHPMWIPTVRSSTASSLLVFTDIDKSTCADLNQPCAYCFNAAHKPAVQDSLQWPAFVQGASQTSARTRIRGCCFRCSTERPKHMGAGTCRRATMPIFTFIFHATACEGYCMWFLVCSCFMILCIHNHDSMVTTSVHCAHFMRKITPNLKPTNVSKMVYWIMQSRHF